LATKKKTTGTATAGGPKKRSALPKTPRKKAPKAGPPDAGQRVALAIAEAALDKKALNVVIIDVRGRVDYADYVVVMGGRSDRQVQAIARGVEDHLGATLGVKCIGSEGKGQGNWVLMDFGDVVAHVFHEDVRGYYDLESFWIDAARVTIPDDGRRDAGGEDA
jgi:ribosome-associated protein